MINTSKTIVFFGTDDFSLTTLKKLHENKYTITAVVTKPDTKSGRGQKIAINPVKKYAIANNIQVWQPNKVSDINKLLEGLQKPILGILVVYGKIIPKSTINLFELGIINIHPSLLPKYRGPSPIESAILNGDKETGVSIMKIDSGMDSGPICSQIIYSLNGSEYRDYLYNTLADVGATMLLNLLPDIFSGVAVFTPQDDKKATYCKLLQKRDGIIHPEKMSSESIERRIRAFKSYPKSKIVVKNYNIIVTESHISNVKKTNLDILCMDGKYLSIDRLISPSGKLMSGKDFINGYRID